MNRDEDVCSNCGAELEEPQAQGVFAECLSCAVDVVDEDWLAGVSCNPNAPEECESCQ